MFHPEDVERFSRCYRALFSENRTFDLEYRVFTGTAAGFGC